VASPALGQFTIVIVNYNGGAMLSRCVESVIASGIMPDRIVLVDNGSRDGSAGELAGRFPDVKVILNGCNAGFARASNQGLAEAGTEFGIILNNDALLSAQALAALEEAFTADPLLAIAGGHLVYPDGSEQNSIAAFPRATSEVLPKPLRRWKSARLQVPDAPHGNLVYVESVVGALFAVRMGRFRALGGFDEDYFFFLEETDLCKRAWDKGLRVVKVENAVITHRQGATAKKYAASSRIEFQRSKLIYFRKHSRPSLYLFMCAVFPVKGLVNALGAALVCLVTCFLLPGARRRARQSAAVLAWYVMLCPQSWGLPDKCPRKADAEHSPS
jgi:N-acetylglucosaminyl-diphospho-decaprenol L-rhamnosyltransferase